LGHFFLCLRVLPAAMHIGLVKNRMHKRAAINKAENQFPYRIFIARIIIRQWKQAFSFGSHEVMLPTELQLMIKTKSSLLIMLCNNISPTTV